MTVAEPSGFRPTLADVARAAGVSIATASRVLNGFPRVSPERRKQVESAMLALGYARQRAAKASSARHTGSIALVVCEEVPRLFTDPYFPRIAAGVGRELTAVGVQLVLLTVPATDDYQSPVVRYLDGGHVDGALVVGMHGRRPLDLDWLGIPVVFGGRPVQAAGRAGRLPYVDADNQGGARLATQRLLDGGRQTVATVTGPQDMTAGVDRLLGYRQAMMRAGRYDETLVVCGDFGQASGEYATSRLLTRRPDVDGIFAASDMMAVGALRALRRAGRRVPDDVALVGFDDLPISSWTDPPLTTVRQPVEEMGARMTAELLAMIDGAAPRRCTVLDTELVPRKSA
ncbi:MULTISPECIES: LacI family DNA-binding transcriptional regulator [unclassified Amycolatopsis]|uniref:LacI family DNA-binding transcriptional regulator n=1 Tax=unclassified Amycolatopsis TaxID=2618356 RepID=UPI002874F76B|nr:MULTISPECIES: LacI family DNA-binding transcriptional regulator [unclassified Amycolatopsis]MDS0138728.1 LacI family DNA-binding transcriptional regulator [Amycolatopsis sp. 505]MDS0147222.1 LacI family DNA-binding transcriptional regulator [Amycolatopsis sp. CM201R]